jgi:hypothetical protein
MTDTSDMKQTRRASLRSGASSLINALFTEPKPDLLHGIATGNRSLRLPLRGHDNASEPHFEQSCRLAGCRHCE